MVSKATPSRANLDSERAKRQSKSKQGLSLVKIYLLAYNTVSGLLWAYLLYLTVLSTLTPSDTTSTLAHTSFFAEYLKPEYFGSASSHVPKIVAKIISHLEGGYDFQNLGQLTKWVQTLALLEVVHAALGWVRSPVFTVASQVFSRLWAVWGVVELVPETHNNPLFTTMLFAWSLTETIRYPFYALSLLGIDVYALNWLRYTTFLFLYPLGAGSEAFLSFSTLPELKTLPQLDYGIKAATYIVRRLPTPVAKAIVSTEVGRVLLWNLAKATVYAKDVFKPWQPIEYTRLVLFIGWWPALYMLYTYMLKQRRKFFSKGKTVGGANKAL